MAVSRNIRSLWVTSYDKSIGDVAGYLESGSGFGPGFDGSTPPAGSGLPMESFREWHPNSNITGVYEITLGGYFWGCTFEQTDIDWDPVSALDENLLAGDTTITLTDNLWYEGPTTDYPGYVQIENEIISYTGVSGDYDLTGCVRGQLNTSDVAHDGTASTIYAKQFLRGLVQSIDFEDQDDVYAIRVAIPLGITECPNPPEWDIETYHIYRFEFAKHSIDLVLYDDTETLSKTNIIGRVPNFAPCT